MVGYIVQEASMFNEFLRRLKVRTPDYPAIFSWVKQIYVAGKPMEELWLSTMVEWTYQGKGYKRHHVESAVFDLGADHSWLYEKIQQACRDTVHSGIPTELDDELQENPPEPYYPKP